MPATGLPSGCRTRPRTTDVSAATAALSALAVSALTTPVGWRPCSPLKAQHRLVRAPRKGSALPLGLGDREAEKRQLAMQEGDIVPILVDGL